ncbi:cytochrome b5 [Sergentomyia squamirostris]
MSQKFTEEEVKLKNGKSGNDCWIIVKNSVYNVTNYLKDHPGGDDLILEWGGKDATKAFYDFGHSSDAQKDLKRLKIGEMEEKEKPKAETLPRHKRVTVDDRDLRRKKSLFRCLLCS